MIISELKACYPNKLLLLRLYGIATLLYVPDTCSIQVSLLSPVRAREVLEFEADEYLAEVLSYLLDFSSISYESARVRGCVVTD